MAAISSWRGWRHRRCLSTAVLVAACVPAARHRWLLAGRKVQQGRRAPCQRLPAYSGCMRSHGPAEFPRPRRQRPGPEGRPAGTRGQQLSAPGGPDSLPAPVSRPTAGHWAPSLRQCEETGNCPQAMVQQVVIAMRRFSRCMRSHGVPDWPDPTVDSEGRPGFNLVSVHGTDWNAPYIQNKIYQCEHVMPAGGGVPAIYPGGPG